MRARISGWGLRAMAFLSVGVALYSLRLAVIPLNIWPGIDAMIEAANRSMPLPLFLHAVFASVALIVGPFQFVPGLRARLPKLHRWTGRLYVVSCLVAGAAGIVVASHAAGGPIAGFGFATLAVTWVATTAAAWSAAVSRDFDRHRALMRYSFAMTFGAVTLRLQIPFGFIIFHFHSYAEMSRWLAYTSWIPNLVIVWLSGALARLSRASSGRALPMARS
jgi:hypothetical protein